MKRFGIVGALLVCSGLAWWLASGGIGGAFTIVVPGNHTGIPLEIALHATKDVHCGMTITDLLYRTSDCP